MNAIRTSWLKFFADLSGTRQQIVYVIMGLTVLVVIRGVLIAETTADLVALLNALAPIILLVLGAWLGDRVRQTIQANGEGAPPPKQP